MLNLSYKSTNLIDFQHEITDATIQATNQPKMKKQMQYYCSFIIDNQLGFITIMKLTWIISETRNEHRNIKQKMEHKLVLVTTRQLLYIGVRRDFSCMVEEDKILYEFIIFVAFNNFIYFNKNLGFFCNKTVSQELQCAPFRHVLTCSPIV